MDEVKNLLTVTLVVMAAGSSIYTIKTYMKPGMDLNINLEESSYLDEITNNQSQLTTEQPTTTLENFYTSLTTELSLIENSTTTEIVTNDSLLASQLTSVNDMSSTKVAAVMNGSITSNLERKRSLLDKQTDLHANTVVTSLTKDDDDNSDCKEKPLVNTPLGKIEGIQVNVLGRQINSYLGINYAQAPIGALRFKRPMPVHPWPGKTLSAKLLGNGCMQATSANNSSTWSQTMRTFSEDCLNVNIWTPCRENKQELLPVLFFIHGGSFTQGHNAVDDGSVLASLENLIVVNANYRLGPFGFLHLGNKDGGNLGLHDLGEALKWTRDNIKYFGGNPDAITIAGHSSGALAGALLITSPQTRNLFKRAILQSGASTVFNFYYQQAQKSSEEFATMLGCLRATDRVSSANQDLIWKCIHNTSATELYRTSHKQLSRQIYSYAPWIGDSLLPNLPKQLLEELPTLSGPKEILIGSNSKEAAIFFNIGYPQLFTKKTPTLKDLEEVRQFLSVSLKDWGISRRTLRLINSFFLDKSSALEPKAVLKTMYDIFGDLTFTCSTLYFAEKFAAKSNHSAYYYYYNYRPNNNNNAANSSVSQDELPYVFGHPLRFPHKYTGMDIDLSKKMMHTWANFIRTGKPALSSGHSWPRFTTDSQSYVELNGNEFRVIHQPSSGPLASNGTNSFLPTRFNCDTWKHAFKIFT